MYKCEIAVKYHGSDIPYDKHCEASAVFSYRFKRNVSNSSGLILPFATKQLFKACIFCLFNSLDTGMIIGPGVSSSSQRVV